MRRTLVLLLFAALLLSACSELSGSDRQIQPVTFYYRTVETDFSSDEGLIRGEVRDLGANFFKERDMFVLYFQGPESEDLVSPFPQDTALVDVRRQGGTLEVMIRSEADSPAEFERTLSYACLAKTGLALDSVNKVRVLVQNRSGKLVQDILLSENDLLLYDRGLDSGGTMDVTLYFADETGSFLLTEKRAVPIMSQQLLSQYVLRLLLKPPESGGMKSTLPPGSAVLDVSVENGVCSVDFNGDFYEYRPKTEREEQLTLLSIVNTLCDLDGIDQVQLYFQGSLMKPYVWLDLSSPWSTDTSVVGPIREELGEFAGTLCLPGQNDMRLHRLTVRARVRTGATREETLLQMLFDRITQNGLVAPVSDNPTPLSVTANNEICTVSLAAGTLPTDAYSREMAIRSITATLTSLPEISAVVIVEGADIVTGGTLAPTVDWFCSPRAS